MDLFVRDNLPARGASDGTYNPDLNAYILPPLVGLPFDDMRANGEGARHRGDKHYYNLIVAHAVFMCLAFLLFVPLAIFQARFRAYKNPRRAIKAHIFANVFTIICAIIGFVCAYLAVGKNRSWTNPHHVIGLTIFVLILLQALLGMIVHHRGKYKVTPHIPLRTMLHRWVGRAVWLLGLAQVPLGLTLYGSPKVLFILYSIWTFFLLVSYFISEFHRGRHHTAATVTTDAGYDYDEHEVKTEKTGFFKKAAVAGLGLFALKKVKDRYEEGHREDEESRVSRSSRRSNRQRNRTPSADYTYAADTNGHHRASPGVKTGLLAGILASGKLRRKKGEDRVDTRPDSPSQRKQGFFAGMFPKRNNLDMTMGASPKKKRRLTGDGGWFSKRKQNRQERGSVSDSTGYDSDYDSTAIDSRVNRGTRHNHTTNDALAAGALGVGVGALAAAHHNRDRRSGRDVYSNSEDGSSYMYSEVDRAQDRIHSGGLQPPPLAQNGVGVGGYNRTVGASTISSVTDDSRTDTNSYTNSNIHNSRLRQNAPILGAAAVLGANELNERERQNQTNPHFYAMPSPTRMQDSAAQVSTANLPPHPGAPPTVPIPMPPTSSRANSYRLHRSGSSSRRGSGAGAGAAAAAAAATGLGIMNSRTRSRDRANSEYTPTDISPSAAGIPLPASTVLGGASQPQRGYRIPATVAASDLSNSDVDAQGNYLPQAALQVRIKKEDNGRTVTTIKRMPHREENTITSPTTAGNTDRPSSSGVKVREERRRDEGRYRDTEGEEEDEVERAKEARREKRRRRRTMDAQDENALQVPSAASGRVARPVFK